MTHDGLRRSAARCPSQRAQAADGCHARRAARRRCWSAASRRPAIVPIEAHIIEPLGAYDIVDLKLGIAVPAGPHAERLRRGAG